MTQFSTAQRHEDVDEVAAVGVMGATRRGGGAFQSWVKPAVDSPRVCERQRDSYLGRVHRPRMTHFSAAKRREDVDEAAARGVIGTRKLACCDG